MKRQTPLGKVLITGATGFTGSKLARTLRDRGYEVRALVRHASDASGLAASGIEIVRGDVTSSADVERVVCGTRYVYHIAAIFRTAGHSDEHYWTVNVEGTRNVMEAAYRHGVERVVHCSTVGVHGGVVEIPSNEDSPLNPGDIYQVTKLEGEKVARQAFANGLPGVVVRPAGIYGPGDLRFLKLFRAVHNGTFRIFGTGEVPYHFTYIDDLVAGMVLCAEHPAAVGGLYILCGHGWVSLNELVRLVAEAVGVDPPRGRLPLFPLLAAAAACEWVCRPFGIEPPLHRRRADFFRKARAFTGEKAERELGFTPRIGLAEGLRRTADWYFRNGYLRGGAVRASVAVGLRPS